MAQPNWAPLPDLRELRTRFLEKQLAYALSYEYKLQCTGVHAPDAKRVGLRLESRDARVWSDPNVAVGAELVEGAVVFGDDHVLKEAIILKDEIVFKDATVFHVFGNDRVPGLDNLGHDVPKGFHVCGLDEAVVLRISGSVGDTEASAGSVQGRMVLRAPNNSEQTDREPVRISVTYGGTVQLAEPIKIRNFGVGQTIRASAFVTPFFETTHPKYHWLTENTTIAFGTWELGSDGVVTASFDVYCAE